MLIYLDQTLLCVLVVE